MSLLIKNKNEMKKLLYVLTFVLINLMFSNISIAQGTFEDVVYLKNGSIIHGTIIEQVPNQSIKIKTRDGNVFFYKLEDIEKMTKEQSSISSNENSNRKREIKQSGFTNITETNEAIGLGDYDGDFSYGIQTINGYLFSPYFSMGLGIVIDKYKASTFLPLFIDLRVNFVKNVVSPFFAGDIGYAMGFEGNNGGLLINPNFGIKFFVSQKTALNFSLGYRLQENSFESNTYWNSNSNVTETGTFLTFKFGAAF